LEEWDDTANTAIGYVMEALTPSSHTRVSWKCRVKGCGHRWESTPHVRVRGIECPQCDALRYAKSRSEIHLRHELAWVFSEALEGKGFPMESGKLRKADIVIPALGLALEYDGAYFHSEELRPGRTDSDRRKTEAMRSAGYHVIRIREAPLEALDPVWDVVVRSPKSNWNVPNFHRWLKEVTNQVLERIETRLPISPPQQKTMDQYRQHPRIQALESALEEIRDYSERKESVAS
jgi:hypothetical protein